MKGLITSQYDGQELSFNEHGWFNATQASKPFDKRPNDWLNLAETKLYIQALCEYMGISEPKSLVKTKRGGNTVTSQNGNAQGTWLHPKLAVPFARWLDSRFGVWCDIQIDQLLKGNHPVFDHRRLRHQAAATYKAVSAVLQLSRQQQGKETKAHHYMNEAKLINWAITGRFSGLDRDSLSYDDLDLLAELETQDLILIGSQCTYEQRKAALSLVAKNFKANKYALAHQSNVLEA